MSANENEVEELAKRLRVIAIGEDMLDGGIYGNWDNLEQEGKMPYLKQANFVINSYRKQQPQFVPNENHIARIIHDYDGDKFQSPGPRAINIARMIIANLSYKCTCPDLCELHKYNPAHFENMREKERIKKLFNQWVIMHKGEKDVYDFVINYCQRFGTPQSKQEQCTHDWVWSNNNGMYFCQKCNDTSYLGTQVANSSESCKPSSKQELKPIDKKEVKLKLHQAIKSIDVPPCLCKPKNYPKEFDKWEESKKEKWFKDEARMDYMNECEYNNLVLNALVKETVNICSKFGKEDVNKELQEKVNNYKQILNDYYEDEEKIKELARPYLPKIDIDGDSWGVPTSVCIVEKLVEAFRKAKEEK